MARISGVLMEKGYVHVYMGHNWKYLQTVQGMVLRASGAGFVVGFYSFDKDYTDINDLTDRLPGLRVLNDIWQDISPLGMIILHDCDLADEADLQKFLADKPPDIEVVLCGATFSEDVLAMADLVSEIISL